MAPFSNWNSVSIGERVRERRINEFNALPKGTEKKCKILLNRWEPTHTTIDTHKKSEKCIEFNVAEEAANTVLFKSKPNVNDGKKKHKNNRNAHFDKEQKTDVWSFTVFNYNWVSSKWDGDENIVMKWRSRGIAQPFVRSNSEFAVD